MSGGAGNESGAVARALIEAVLRGDVEEAVSLTSPDLLLRIESYEDFHGHEGLREFMAFHAEVASEVVVEFHHVLSSGDTAAVNRTETVTVGGQRVPLEVGAFFTLRDGLVTEWFGYQDLRAVNRALGH